MARTASTEWRRVFPDCILTARAKDLVSFGWEDIPGAKDAIVWEQKIVEAIEKSAEHGGYINMREVSVSIQRQAISKLRSGCPLLVKR